MLSWLASSVHHYCIQSLLSNSLCFFKSFFLNVVNNYQYHLSPHHLFSYCTFINYQPILFSLFSSIASCQNLNLVSICPSYSPDFYIHLTCSMHQSVSHCQIHMLQNSHCYLLYVSLIMGFLVLILIFHLLQSLVSKLSKRCTFTTLPVP